MAVTFTPDEIDSKILDVLQREGRISMLELADRVGLSATPCARRVREMEGNGLIRGYAALLSADAVGLRTQAVVRVRIRRSRECADEFEKFVLKMPEVLRCLTVTGPYDYLLYIAAPDMESLGDWIRQKLVPSPGILQTETSVVIRQVKGGVALPVASAASSNWHQRQRRY